MQVAPLRRDARCWILGIAVLTACSWARFAATGSPKVDENYPSEAVGCALMAGVAVGWGLLVFGWRGLLLRPVANPRRLAFTGLALATVMLPLLSNDIFSLIAYGSLAAHGRDVYTTAAALPDSPWFSWVGQNWNDKVCVYGPTTLIAILPAGLAGTNPWLALLLLRALWLVPLLIVMELSFRHFRERPFFHAMVWLNPLWVLEGPGQLHADLLGLIAVVAGMMLQRRGRTLGGAAGWAVATLGKYSFFFTGLWFWLSGARSTRERTTRLAVLAVVVGGLGVAFFAPFWQGPATLLEPIRTLGGMNPGGSIAEVAGHIVHVLRGGAIPSPETPVHVAIQMDRATKGSTWFAVSLVLRILSVAIGVRVLQTILRNPRDEGRIALGTGALVVAAVTLASHRFQAWYLLAALPFFGLRCTPVWRRWWVAIAAVSVAPDFTHVLPKTAVLLPIWSAVSTGACVVLFLVSLRGRFFKLAEEDVATSSAPLVDPRAVAQVAPPS